jgi:hypothetical protein
MQGKLEMATWMYMLGIDPDTATIVDKDGNVIREPIKPAGSKPAASNPPPNPPSGRKPK